MAELPPYENPHANVMLETEIKQMKHEISKGKDAKRQLAQDRQNTETAITQYFEEFRRDTERLVREREDALLQNNHKMAKIRRQALDKRQEVLETKLRQLEMKHSHRGDVTELWVEPCMEELRHNRVPSNPPALPVFNPADTRGFKETLTQQLRDSYLKLPCDPSLCYLSVPKGGIMCLTKGSSTEFEQVFVDLILRNAMGDRESCQKITACLYDDSSNTLSIITTCDVTSSPDDASRVPRYRVSFPAPESTGTYALQVFINHENIHGSPYPVRVYGVEDHPVCSINHHSARYCAIHKKCLIVSAREVSTLIAYNLANYEDNETLGDFINPRGIGTAGNAIFVADVCEGSGKIVKINQNPSGDTRTECFAEKQLDWPLGLRFDKDGLLYATSMKSKQIKIYKQSTDESYKLYTTMDLPYKPFDLAFDADDHLHVAYGDSEEKVNGIFVYDKHTLLLRQYGIDNICCPGGIAIDSNGFVYATEYCQHGRLVVFDPSGKKVFASDNTGLDYPMGVCVSIMKMEGSLLLATWVEGW